MELQTKFDVRSADTKFLLDATNQLLQNRKVLEFSYVYGYYLREQAVSQQERNLFEYLQEELEKHTNHLRCAKLQAQGVFVCVCVRVCDWMGSFGNE